MSKFFDKYFDNETKILKDNFNKIKSNNNIIDKIYITDDSYKIKDKNACVYIKNKLIKYIEEKNLANIIDIPEDEYCSFIFIKKN